MTITSATKLLTTALLGIAEYETERATGGDPKKAKGDLIQKISALGEPLQMAEMLAEQKGYASLKEALETLTEKQ